ncbi:MAG: glutamate--tRNA ligase [Patescibacteria group bacterium]
MEEIRTRIAPSPTGYLHIGTARTALFNYLFAKQAGGKFIVRIEDTDHERSEEKYVLDITNGLSWLGLNWDEGPFTEGEFGPYYQSKKTERYNECVKILLDQNLAYKKDGAIWFRIPEKIDLDTTEIIVKDLIRGDVHFKLTDLKDFVIVKSDGTPIFHLAVVVDDYDMKISHIIRGEDHLSNTPKHILLQKALNFPTPIYAHLPLIVNPNHSKMSKRKDPVSISNDFKDKGYLPEAMINFISLLGWSPKNEDEIFSLQDLITEFDLTRVGKSPSVFNQQKLDWINGLYIRKMSLGDLAKQLEPFYSKHGVNVKGEYLLSVIALIQERLKNLDEAYSLSYFMFDEKIEVPPEMLLEKLHDKNLTKNALEKSYKIIEAIDFTHDKLESELRNLATEMNITAKGLFQTLRVAVCGTDVAPPLFQTFEVLGKEKVLKRINEALNLV